MCVCVLMEMSAQRARGVEVQEKHQLSPPVQFAV